jgi:L-fucose mutarotase
MPEHVAAGWKTPIWDEYKTIIIAANGATEFEEVERFAFYERSKKAFAIISTGETALYGNLIIKKGIIGTSE